MEKQSVSPGQSVCPGQKEIIKQQQTAKQKPTNTLGLSEEQALKFECYKTILPYSRDINGIRKQVEDLIAWLKNAEITKY